MPIIQPDLSEIDAPLESGTYAAKIIECDAQTSKKDNPMIVPKFELVVDGKRRVRQAYLVITGQGAYGFQGLLRACGFHEYADRLKAGSKEPFDTDQLIGQELNVVVEETLYNGEKRDQIKSYLKA